MAHPRRLLLVAALALLAIPASATATPLLRLDGIGPLKLGMKRSAAVATGWLGPVFKSGCDAAGNPPSAHVNGRNAPRGVKGTAEFVGGRLNNFSFTGGVHTALGVVPGRSTTGFMLDRYGRAGFNATANYSSLFGANFVNVKKRGKFKIMGIATHQRINQLGIPSVPLCE